LPPSTNKFPFYVALPSSTIDYNGNIHKVLVTPKESPAINYGFDVTPARLITGIITEKGIAKASEDGLLQLFPEIKSNG